ncbi:CRAL/TRIO domain-containing protein [Basidiobolus meristosporus CBS 931.73]|uniref:CRAL/TRIO domain-containing protein n=1 Tax=Basidiobolus meristosporus CBS 931.73 TaxID=1314790 RepID=A0A1Y1YZ11_9FUNG|nr:CRAL/TRIO domain-containing protein [Basidiobolus meristosporus CBS 931.73]|eukprot:ORY03262.1 CRAL/TRIO domain-containing protein [Basidiobolus meristosporus CBS 931.73]
MNVPSLDSITLKNIRSQVPQAYTLTQRDISRFWYANKGHFKDTCKSLSETMHWRQEFNYDNILEEDFSDLVKTRKVFFHGNAKDGTPVLVWRSCKHFANPEEREREKRFYVWILAKAEKEGLLPEKVTIVYDRTGATHANADLGLAKEVFPLFQHHFPERLKNVFVFPSSFLLSSLWYCVRPFIDTVTAQKVHIWKENEYQSKILEYIDTENLLERFGGTGVESTGTSIGTETVKIIHPHPPETRCKLEDHVATPSPTEVL